MSYIFLSLPIQDNWILGDVHQREREIESHVNHVTPSQHPSHVLARKVHDAEHKRLVEHVMHDIDDVHDQRYANSQRIVRARVTPRKERIDDEPHDERVSLEEEFHVEQRAVKQSRRDFAAEKVIGHQTTTNKRGEGTNNVSVWVIRTRSCTRIHTRKPAFADVGETRAHDQQRRHDERSELKQRDKGARFGLDASQVEQADADCGRIEQRRRDQRRQTVEAIVETNAVALQIANEMLCGKSLKKSTEQQRTKSSSPWPAKRLETQAVSASKTKTSTTSRDAHTKQNKTKQNFYNRAKEIL